VSMLPFLKFPFLIGTVRTLEKLGEIEPEQEFPFLIGTVRTKSDIISMMNQLLVSIPHRYGKNSHLCIRFFAYP